MGYYDYLCGLLEPLGIYNLSDGAGAAELMSIGAQLDEIFKSLEEFGWEGIPLTAQGEGLARLEELFPYRPSYITAEDRRRAVMALLRIRGGYFTVEALCDTLSGCGINAVASECSEPMTVEISFPDNRGIPEDIDQLKLRIEQILPCHLRVIYRYIYALWHEFETGVPDWHSLQELCGSWRALEIFQ